MAPSTRMAPSVAAAQAYREAQLPHRIIEASSALGFRRAREGEAGDECEVYPVFEPSDLFEAMDSFGIGVSLYFRQLAALFAVVAVAAVVLGPSTARNARVCDHAAIRATHRNAGLARGTAAGCLAADLGVAANVAPDVAVCARAATETTAAPSDGRDLGDLERGGADVENSDASTGIRPRRGGGRTATSVPAS